MSAPRVWFITGASSGFGRCMTELALQKGEKVAATLRKPEALDDLKAQHPSSRLLILPLDVTQPAQIAAAFDAAIKAFGRVDVVFNNAGYTVLGEVESVKDKDARAVFEVNFWGAAHIAQHAVKVFREANVPIGGRLINSSSFLGIVGAPAIGWYSATKHALEGLLESLAGELDPEWNIKVSIVELGGYRTRAESSIVRTAQLPAYAKPTLVPSIVRATLGSVKGRAGPQDPVKASARIFELSLLEQPPLRLPLGQHATAFIGKWLAGFEEGIKPYLGWSEGLEWEHDD